MVILSSNEVLLRGLRNAGSSDRQVSANVSFATKVGRFKSCFGAHPFVYARLWIELQGFDTERKIEMFFMFLFWLKTYPTEAVLAVRYNLPEKDVRLWCWYYAECLKVLSETLIVMPDQFDDKVPFPLAVDGTHCMIYEPMHNLYPMDRGYFSHKHHTACYTYQLAVSTTESKILSIHGPYAAGKYSDKVMFQESGLQAMLVSQNKWAIADGGYDGLDGAAVPDRKYHSKLTNIYFRRNRARIERLMGYFKNFEILSGTFRHKQDRLRKHGMVFHAVGAIVAVQLATKNPLFKA